MLVTVGTCSSAPTLLARGSRLCGTTVGLGRPSATSLRYNYRWCWQSCQKRSGWSATERRSRMQYHCKKGMHHEWIEDMTPAHAAQEYHYHTATARDKHVLDNGDGKLTVYGQVEVVGHSVWICRTHLRPLRQIGRA